MSRLPFHLRPWLRRFAAVGMLVLAVESPVAQDLAPRFQRLTVDGGLPHNAVVAVAQDPLGFVWLGTSDGLVRFDGYAPETFLYDPADSGSISSNRIHALLTARDGTLWVGTDRGLDRFDPLARRFDRLAPGAGGRSTAMAGSVVALAEDAGGRIWVAEATPEPPRGGPAAGAVSIVDPRTGRAVRLPVDVGTVRALAPAGDGGVWIGATGGLVHVTRDGRPATRALRGREVRAIVPEADGAVWAALWGGGLRRITAEGTEATAGVPIRDRDGGLPSGFVATLVRGSDGALWLSTAPSRPGADGALCRFVYKAFECTSHRAGDAAGLPAGAIHAAFEDRNGVLWVGTDGGVAWADLKSRLVPHFAYDPARPDGLGGRVATAFLDEGKGVLWVGTNQGLSRFDRERLVFTHLRHRPGDPTSLSSDDVRALARGPDGVLWVGTAAGLDLLDARTRRVRRWRPAGGSDFADVRALQVDADGVVWAGTGHGLFRIDPDSRSATAYRPRPGDPASLPGERITALLAPPGDPQGIWVGTAAGLSYVDRRTGRGRRYDAVPTDPRRLADASVTALAVRPGERGFVWVGTEDGALARLDVRTGGVVRFSPADGRFPGRTVFGLVADREGTLWASAREGIVRLDADHLEAAHLARRGAAHDEACYRIYEIGRGVQSRQFTPGAAFRTATGEVAFGGINGFNLFGPEDLVDNPHAPPVVLTALRVGGRSVAAGESGLLDLPLPYARSVRLPFDRNDLAFDFVALHHGRPADNRYEVWLEHHDPGWVPLGAQRSVAYANLPPGAYTFRVRAANADGRWGTASAALAVLIAPPWWATWWARLAGLGLLAGALASGYHWRIRQIRAQNRRLARAVAERTAELREQKDALRRQAGELAEQTAQAQHHAGLISEKNRELEATLDALHAAQVQLVQAEKLAGLGRLTAGVAHEIKNPLNFVNNFAQLSGELAAELRDELDALRGRRVEEALVEVAPLLDDLAENAAKIAEHGRRADGIVRNMLLHARGVSGERRALDLHALLDEAASHALAGGAPAGDGADGGGVELARDYDPAVPSVEAAGPALHRAVLNVVENAAYAVRARAARAEPGYRPRIRVATRLHGNGVKVTVADNGDGVPEAARARLFEPFYTTKPTGQGTGLGLSIAHDIVRGHGGTLEVGGAPGEGAVFTLTLPVRPPGHAIAQAPSEVATR